MTSAATEQRAPESTRRLTGRDGIRGIKARAAVALQDAFLQRALPVSQDGMRFKRDAAVEAFGHEHFEALRKWAEQLRRHTLEHLDYYLQQLATNVRANGGHVFFAETAQDAVDYIMNVVRRRGVKTVIKSKSMVSEEVLLNDALIAEGVRPVETDLGEYIIQLAGHTPSHIIGPALHMSRDEIADIFSREAGRELPADSEVLTAYARERLREDFLAADMGVTGCNFAVAENGAIAIVTNEGNGRMVTSLPPVQVTIMGMERIVPTMADLDAMLDLLPRSATGQKASVYTTITRGVRGEGEPDGPEEFHLVIVDNGRSRLIGGDFQDVLHCIRCGACLNACPVYRHIGGHAYGWVYSGPIGAVLTPLLKGFEEYGDLPDASSLCGACHEVCPVRIPLHDYLIGLRTEAKKRQEPPWSERTAFALWAWAMGSVGSYRFAQRLARWLQKPFMDRGVVSRGPGPLAAWTRQRDLPPVAARTFRERWNDLAREGTDARAAVAGGRPMTPS